MFSDKIQEDIFDRQRVAILPVQLSAAFSLPSVDPISGALAGATKAALFDKGLQKHGPILVRASDNLFRLCRALPS